MLSFFWNFFGWEEPETSVSVSSDESLAEVLNGSQQNTESQDDNLSMRELKSRFPALARGDQFVTIKELAHDVSGYFLVPMEGTLFEVAVVSKYLHEPFDDILVGKRTLVRDFNTEPAYERLNGFIEEHKNLIEKIIIYKYDQNIYDQFLAIRRNSMDNIRCDEYGFITDQ